MRNNKEQFGILVSVGWTSGVIATAIISHRLLVAAFLGVLPLLLIPFRKKREI